MPYSRSIHLTETFLSMAIFTSALGVLLPMLTTYDPAQAWMHKTSTKKGRYTITWTTGGDESGLLHYALPHQQVGTGLFDFSDR